MDHISLGSQLQNLPHTNSAYTKPVTSPTLSTVNPIMIHRYPVLSISSREGSRLKNAVAKDQALKLEDVILPTDSLTVKLRQEQDAAFA